MNDGHIALQRIFSSAYSRATDLVKLIMAALLASYAAPCVWATSPKTLEMLTMAPRWPVAGSGGWVMNWDRAAFEKRNVDRRLMALFVQSALL